MLFDLSNAGEVYFDEIIKRKINGYKVIFWGCGNNAKITLPLLNKKKIIPDYFCDTHSDKYNLGDMKLNHMTK